MSSRGVALLGCQVPRVALVPACEWTEADDAAFLAASYGLVPDDWQMLVLNGWLSRRADGRWAAPIAGIAVPRQNGKNGILEIVELYKMVALGRKILHTAHEVKTARKAFIRLKYFFGEKAGDPAANFPELNALVKEVRSTNGQEAIVLKNGASVEFIARSRGSGRGFTVDDLVCDEAQELSEEALAALLPTISSAPSGDATQTYMGTPPGPTMDGEVFTRWRNEGLKGTSDRLAWYEWSIEGNVNAEPGTPNAINVYDRSLWATSNPSLGRRLNIETISDEILGLGPEGFARERLGLWASTTVLQVIDADAWSARAVEPDDVPTDGRVAFALDMPPDRSRISISAASRPEDGPVHVECVYDEPAAVGVSEVVDWLAERWPTATAIVIDGQSPAMSFVNELSRRKVRVTVSGAGDMARACGMFVDAVRDEELTHFDQEQVNDALKGAKKRTIGQAGGWGWDRRDPDVDLSPLVSVTLAFYGVMTSKRKPGRTAKVVVM